MIRQRKYSRFLWRDPMYPLDRLDPLDPLDRTTWCSVFRCQRPEHWRGAVAATSLRRRVTSLSCDSDVVDDDETIAPRGEGKTGQGDGGRVGEGRLTYADIAHLPCLRLNSAVCSWVCCYTDIAAEYLPQIQWILYTIRAEATKLAAVLDCNIYRFIVYFLVQTRFI